MIKSSAKNLINEIFSNEFNRDNFLDFSNKFLYSATFQPTTINGDDIPKIFQGHVQSLERLATYTDSNNKEIDLLIVTLLKDTALDRARTMQRNFIAQYLETASKNAALVAFVSPDVPHWRFSLIKIDAKIVGIEVETTLTPSKRWSFLVGKNEGCYTVKSKLIPILLDDNRTPSLDDLEKAFDIETVSKEFFQKYSELFFRMKESLDDLIEIDQTLKNDFQDKEIDTSDFAKKTMGQIAFLYFLQKKGWFGVAPKNAWGSGVKNFLREVFERRENYGTNFFDDVLEPLFYEALAQDRGNESIYPKLNNCRMPFLNGGLFEPMNGYSWETTHIRIPDELFSNINKTKEGDTGDGILDVFDRYNFTVNESNPLEMEVAVDPEMLGKVFENLLEIKDRKSQGAFYTPREIVHYMCQDSLINYLETEVGNSIPKSDIEFFIKKGPQIIQNDKAVLNQGRESESLKYLLPKSIRDKLTKLDGLLTNIKVCDPAVGSGAFSLGMLNEIVSARTILSIYLKNDLTSYDLKFNAISNSIYGVDIDPGAIEIAKLRLWLSLVVEENNPIPLPNLDHKIMQGNSLVSQYEGIDLFDDDFLNSAKSVEIEKQDIQSEINSLQRHYLSLNSEGSLTNEKKVEIEKNVKTLNRRIKYLDNKINTIDDSVDLFDENHAKKIAQQKLNLLQKKISEYVTEARKTSKQNLKNEIDRLKWDLIELTFEESGETEKLTEIKNLRKRSVKPFFIWKLEFGEVFNLNGGFDIIIANPPYISESTNREAFNNLRHSSYYQGKMDLWYFFACISLDLLKKGGVMAFIATNNWVTNFGAKKMRNKIIRDSKILTLINFNNFKIFDTAGIQTMITMVQKDDVVNNYLIDYRKLTNDAADISNVKDLLSMRSTDGSEIFSPLIIREDFIDKSFNFNDPSVERVLNKIQKVENYTLSKNEVANGIQSHHDSVTKKMLETLGNNFSIGDGIFALHNDELQNLSISDEEKKLIKPYFTTSELFKYSGSEDNKNWIIYTSSEFKNPDKFLRYPNLKNHLDKFESVISSDNKPYGLHRARDEEFYKGEKIVSLRKCSKGPCFTYTDYDCYVSATFFVIKTEKTNQKFLTGFLNSAICAFWLRNKGKMQGNNYQIDKEPLVNIPIPVVSESLQDQIIELVNQIIANKKLDIDTSHLERQADNLFYTLYKFTDEDIELIETSSNL